jgi:hypothetical protein
LIETTASFVATRISAGVFTRSSLITGFDGAMRAASRSSVAGSRQGIDVEFNARSTCA